MTSWLLVSTDTCSKVSICCHCILFRREKNLKHFLQSLGLYLYVSHQQLRIQLMRTTFSHRCLGCKPHCSCFWKRKETIKIRSCASFEVLGHKGRFLCWVADFPNATQLDPYQMFLSRRQWKWLSMNKRTDEKCAVIKAGKEAGRVLGSSSKTNSLSRSEACFIFDVLFIALIGIVFPWKWMECRGRLCGLVLWPFHCSGLPC